MRLKEVSILILIMLSLLLVYSSYKYLEKVMWPRESLRRFLLWVVAVLGMVLVYTFFVVLIIKLVFPGA